jgi:hypothetical protein
MKTTYSKNKQPKPPKSNDPILDNRNDKNKAKKNYQEKELNLNKINESPRFNDKFISEEK